jgi:hypothetical protein
MRRDANRAGTPIPSRDADAQKIGVRGGLSAEVVLGAPRVVRP